MLAEAATNSSGGLDPAYVAAAASVAAALIAAVVAVALHLLGQQQQAQERKRQLCAKALADALSWLELPYRVRRRVDDSPATLAALTSRMHDIQESLLYHQSWLAIEIAEVKAAYVKLVGAVKSSAADALQQAWRSPPAQSPEGMNVGSLDLPSVDAEIKAFVDKVRQSL